MSITKTLPMKFKSMHYALLAFITQSDEFAADVKVSLIAKLPVLDTVENQLIFYEKLVDFKTVEKDIVKPMIKKRKQEETEAAKPPKPVKEKKPRAPKKAALTPPASAAPAPPPEIAPVIIEKVVIIESTPVVPIPAVTVAATATATATAIEKPKKKRVVKKAVPAKVHQENAVVLTETDETQHRELSLTDEMKEEPYKVTKGILIPRPVLKRATNFQEGEAQEYYLFLRDGVKYWTTDDDARNGLVYDYEKDEEGDGAPGKLVGQLENGKLKLM